jgi:hypothetical protein
MDWTVDTWVLYQAAKAEHLAHELLDGIRLHEHRVGFDKEGRIVAEYRRCLQVTKSREVARWFKAAVDKLAITRSGKLDPVHEAALRNLRFHDDDWPFVAVSARTNDRRLVSEESDYTKDVRGYLSEKMSVSVLGLAQSLALCT